jgi:SAM-dependent methyltransferase
LDSATVQLGVVSPGVSMTGEKYPQVCDYEGSDYQDRFWDKGGRAYEDGCEAFALKKLLPKSGKLLLELGAGAGRNTLRYAGFERIVLLDYSRTQLQQARIKLGSSKSFIFVAADIYRLPFVDGLFDGATMIRVLHHMADASCALQQVRSTLKPGAIFILEYANKRNVKAILRYALHRQAWNPFTLEPVEFTRLNFDFHPRMVHTRLEDLGFQIEKIRTVSHFRIGALKRLIPPAILIWLDSLLQWTGSLIQLTPSVFVRSRVAGKIAPPAGNDDPITFFKCPTCGHHPLTAHSDHLACSSCSAKWLIEDGIYNFKG